jgi:chromosome segregation ATPase
MSSIMYCEDEIIVTYIKELQLEIETLQNDFNQQYEEKQKIDERVQEMENDADNFKKQIIKLTETQANTIRAYRNLEKAYDMLISLHMNHINSFKSA